MTMTRYREILRLHSLGDPIGEIAAAAGCHRNTAKRVIERAGAAGLEWPLPDELGDGQLARILYPDKYGKHGDYVEPDYDWVHRELKRKGVTRSLLYCEYRDACKAAGDEACSITTFNQGYADWAARKSVVMHIERRPGQKMEVDWAGSAMSLVDRDTGELVDVYVFVACMPFSGKLYAEGFLGMDSECWLAAHVRALDFYGGVPEELVPDNCRIAVTKHTRDELLVNRAYADLAAYYGCAIVPARVRRPRDKANVEAGVGIVTRRAIAALRDRTFFTLAELNAALQAKAAEINEAPFTRKPGSRSSVFDAQERDSLAPLPAAPFQVCSWERVTVRSDYHVFVRDGFYSVPFEYIGKVVDVRVADTAVEVFFDDVRIASHPRLYDAYAHSTKRDHMPQNHVGYLEWDADGLARKAAEVGPACERVMAVVLSGQETKKQSIGQGKSLLALARRYGNAVLESACAQMADVGLSRASAAAVESLCRAARKSKGDVEDTGEHAILRGEDYYRKKAESPAGPEPGDDEESEE